MNISPNPDPGAGMESALKKIQESAKTVNPGELKPDEKPRRGRVAGKKATPTPGTGVALPMAQPDPAIAEIIKIPFDIWSNSQNLKELKLKNDEALNLSRPVKTLLDHYLPQVSPVGYVWISFALIMTNTLSTRMMIVSNERTKRKKIITITGQRGSGKSTLVKQILPSKTRLLVYDTLGEYNAHGVVINNLPDLARFWTTTHRGSFKIIYQPLDPFGEFDIICRLIFECGNVCFCVEEIDSFISRSPAGLDYSFLNIVQRGRHKHIELIAITQRPFAIPPILRSQTKVFYSFCQMESRDIDWYKNIYGDSADELRNLKTFEYLVYDNGNVSNGKTSY